VTLSATPSCSIVIPALNEADGITACLSRLASQWPDAERIVVDGGSTDGTAEKAAALARVVRSPRGRGTQMAAGARAASGDILVFLHADTLMADRWPDAVRAALADAAIAAAGFTQRFDAPGLFFRMNEWFANRRTARGTAYGDGGFAIRRETYDLIGGYSEIPLFEDIEISKRARAVGRVVRIAPVITISPRRWERLGPWRTMFRNWSLLIRYHVLRTCPSTLALIYYPSATAPVPTTVSIVGGESLPNRLSTGDTAGIEPSPERV
jgi:rSAM/selenodomain-associated transferase 2